MKLPKSLIHSILVGITAGSMACSFDTVTTVCEDLACEHGVTCPANNETRPDPCYACGMG